MSVTMRAAVLHGPKDLRVEELPVPSLNAGEVLVKVVANGLCHTDVTVFEAKIPEKARIYPLILGHEAAGIIEAVADDVTSLKPGDAVLLPPVYGCGECVFCKSGADNICGKSVMLGQSRHGSYAEYTSIPAQYAFKFSAEVDLKKACVAADAVSTVYFSLKERVGVRPGDNVAVFGCGGLGLAALNVAKVLGAEKLYAIDVREESLEAAKALGAEPVNAQGQEKLYKTLKKMSNDSIRVAMDCVGFGNTIEQAFNTVCKGGEVGVIGFSGDTATFRCGMFMGLQKRIGGTWGCPTRLFPDVVKMIQDGKIELDKLVSRQYVLNDVLKAFEDLDAGKIVGRAVVEIA